MAALFLLVSGGRSEEAVHTHYSVPRRSVTQKKLELSGPPHRASDDENYITRTLMPSESIILA